MTDLAKEIADALHEIADDTQRAPSRTEARSDFNSAIRAGGSWLKAAAKRAGMTPQEYERSLQAQEKQARDERGRYAVKDDDEDTEPESGRGFDGGARGAPPKKPGNQSMNDSIRQRAGFGS